MSEPGIIVAIGDNNAMRIEMTGCEGDECFAHAEAFKRELAALGIVVDEGIVERKAPRIPLAPKVPKAAEAAAAKRTRIR